MVAGVAGICRKLKVSNGRKVQMRLPVCHPPPGPAAKSQSGEAGTSCRLTNTINTFINTSVRIRAVNGGLRSFHGAQKRPLWGSHPCWKCSLALLIYAVGTFSVIVKSSLRFVASSASSYWLSRPPLTFDQIYQENRVEKSDKLIMIDCVFSTSK